jgi:uncharacterized membrane protein YkoI
MTTRPGPLSRPHRDAIQERYNRAARVDPEDPRAAQFVAASAADVPVLIEEIKRLSSKVYALDALVQSSKGQAEEWDLEHAAGNPAYSAEFVRGAAALSAVLIDVAAGASDGRSE